MCCLEMCVKLCVCATILLAVKLLISRVRCKTNTKHSLFFGELLKTVWNEVCTFYYYFFFEVCLSICMWCTLCLYVSLCLYTFLTVSLCFRLLLFCANSQHCEGNFVSKKPKKNKITAILFFFLVSQKIKNYQKICILEIKH